MQLERVFYPLTSTLVKAASSLQAASPNLPSGKTFIPVIATKTTVQGILPLVRELTERVNCVTGTWVQIGYSFLTFNRSKGSSTAVYQTRTRTDEAPLPSHVNDYKKRKNQAAASKDVPQGSRKGLERYLRGAIRQAYKRFLRCF